MNKALATWNIVVTLILVLLFAFNFRSRSKVHAEEAPQTIKTHRLEIVDDVGKIKAVLEADGTDRSGPKLVLFDSAGREAAILSVNSNGYGTMYFQDKRLQGKVSVGYLWGSDTPTPRNEDDPLSSWGIRIRGINGTQKSFGLLNDGQPISERK
jgi:hypothetical protein